MHFIKKLLQKDRSGFSHFEMVLIIVVVGVIAATGLFVYNHQKNKSNLKKYGCSGMFKNRCESLQQAKERQHAKPQKSTKASLAESQRRANASDRLNAARNAAKKTCGGTGHWMGRCMMVNTYHNLTDRNFNKKYNQLGDPAGTPLVCHNSTLGTAKCTAKERQRATAEAAKKKAAQGSGSSGSYGGAAAGGAAAVAAQPTGWKLTGVSDASTHFKNAGQKAGYFHGIKNNGPATAKFKYYVATGWFDNKYNWKEKGGKWEKASAVREITLAAGASNPSLQRGSSNFLNTTRVVPKDARDGDHICETMFYTNADGPNDGKYTKNPNWKKGCVTVMKSKKYTTVVNGTFQGATVKSEACWRNYESNILRLKTTVNIPANYQFAPNKFTARAGTKVGAADIIKAQIDIAPPDATSADLSKINATPGIYASIEEFNTDKVRGFNVDNEPLYFTLLSPTGSKLDSKNKFNGNLIVHCPPEEIRPQYFVGYNSSPTAALPNPQGTKNNNKSNNSGLVYPHAYPALTRVHHLPEHKLKSLVNYDIWWTDNTRQVLVVQFRISVPENSDIVPGKVFSNIYNGTPSKANLIASGRIQAPLDEDRSHVATLKQVKAKNAPAGRYWGEIHITRAMMKGSNVLYFNVGYDGADKNLKSAFGSSQAIDVNKVFWITNTGVDKIHAGRNRLQCDYTVTPMKCSLIQSVNGKPSKAPSDKTPATKPSTNTRTVKNGNTTTTTKTTINGNIKTKVTTKTTIVGKDKTVVVTTTTTQPLTDGRTRTTTTVKTTVTKNGKTTTKTTKKSIVSGKVTGKPERTTVPAEVKGALLFKSPVLNVNGVNTTASVYGCVVSDLNVFSKTNTILPPVGKHVWFGRLSYDTVKQTPPSNNLDFYADRGNGRESAQLITFNFMTQKVKDYYTDYLWTDEDIPVTVYVRDKQGNEVYSATADLASVKDTCK